MDRTNKLEVLRKRNNLSQEEVFEKMGFYGYGRTSKNISKYETGEQQMPFLTAIMYAQSVGATLDEMAYLLYPEQPYHDIHGISDVMSNKRTTQIKCKKVIPKDHTCIMGTHIDGVERLAIVPAFNKAIEKGESIFYFGDAELVRHIADEHPEYEVHYSTYPYSDLNILPEKTSIEDIMLFINRIADLSEGLGVGDEYFRDISERVLYDVIINMIDKGKDITLSSISEELNHLDTCDYIEDEDCNYLFMHTRGMRNFITYLAMYLYKGDNCLKEGTGMVFVDDICQKNHIIVVNAFPLEKDSAINITLMFMQYCKKVNEYHMKTNIILEETGLFLKHIPYGELVEHLRNDEIYDTWTIAIPSIEVLQSIYGGDVSELMLRFPNIQTTLRHMSMNTEKYISSVMDDTLKLDDKEFISIKRINGIPYREEK